MALLDLGIPPGFTFPGKVFSGVLRWMEGNFQSAELCRMIEGGEPACPADEGREPTWTASALGPGPGHQSTSSPSITGRRALDTERPSAMPMPP